MQAAPEVVVPDINEVPPMEEFDAGDFGLEVVAEHDPDTEVAQNPTSRQCRAIVPPVPSVPELMT